MGNRPNNGDMSGGFHSVGLFMKHYGRPSKITTHQITHGKVIVTRPADPELVEAWHKSAEYKQIRDTNQSTFNRHNFGDR